MNPFDTLTAPIEHRIATGFAKIAALIRSEAWEKGLIEGITPTQGDILTLLAGRSGSLRLSVIAQELLISPPTASDAVSTLVAKELVAKVKASDDRRAIAISLTKKGEQVAGTISSWDHFLVSILEKIPHEEKVTLLNLLVKIIRLLQERGDIPVTRMCLSCDYYSANPTGEQSHPHYCNLVKSPFADKHLRLDCGEHSFNNSKVFAIKKI